MKEINTNKLIAYMTLGSGLMISGVAECYSILGLTAIFSAAVIPIIIMGIAIGIGKLVGTLWLKQHWKIAPFSIKVYLSSAVMILMLITSMGIFGFLSKAHSDQSLVSGDVMAKIAVYDEKIKISKENIDANRKALRQMDEAVDQVMARSSSETGANQAVSIRRSQQKERARLQSEINSEQKKIVAVSEERAPIAADVRKVEAEVGPIKYIAQFVYGATDDAILERAVTWVILLIIFVFDPLALILLIASQVSFQQIKNENNNIGKVISDEPIQDSAVEDDKDDTLTDDQIALVDSKEKEIDHIDLWNKIISAVDSEPKATAPVELEPRPYVWKTTVFPPAVNDNESTGYVQNEEQAESSLWNDITQATQISEQDYHEAIERSIEEMVDNVRRGLLPFYKVPYEIQDQVKQKLQNGNENNSNNPA